MSVHPLDPFGKLKMTTDLFKIKNKIFLHFTYTNKFVSSLFKQNLKTA